MKSSERNLNYKIIFLNMKRIKLIFAMLLVISGLFTMQSCKKDEAVPFSEKASFTIPALVAPETGVFLEVAGTTIDLKWESTNADGSPENWNVYFGTSEDPSRIKTAYGQQSITVDVQKGYKYFWRVDATDPNGIVSRGPLWNFEVVDPAAAMNMKMTWTTNSLDAIGLDLDPDKAANLRLLIRKEDKTSQATVNTTAFEEYNNWHTLADGKYYIATDIFSTVDAGDFNSPIDISIDLAFAQRGVNNETVSFPSVMTNQFACSTYRIYLGYLVKSGSTYTFTNEVTYPVSPLSHVWYGLDNTGFEYPSQVETYLGCSLQIKGLSFDWMSDYWGEVIVKGGTASITIDVTTGIVTIPNQFYCRTKWNGAVQPDYWIEGVGTYDATGAFPTMTITYDLLQNGTSMAEMDDLSTPKFVATLTLDPAQAKRLGKTLHYTIPAVKPAR
jgi:hypothetical protein